MSNKTFEKVKSETRVLEKITMLIPGFRGYKQKELRREADKLIRNHLNQRLTQSKEDLKLVFQHLVDNKLTDVWTDMDRLITNLDAVASQINHASYGYSGFYDAVKVQEKNLDAMLDYDEKLVDNIESLDEKAKQFKSEALNGQFKDTRTHVKEIREIIDLLDRLYEERKNIILGV